MHTEYIGAGRNPKKRKRYLQLNIPDTKALATLSAEWRDLLTQCVKNGENARWKTWLKIADISRKTMLEDLLAWLLKQGWVCVFEEKHSGDWWPYRVELQHIYHLRLALNLPNPDAQASQWQAVRNALQQLAELKQDQALLLALGSLDAMPISRAMTRAELVKSLLTWREDERVGTYRDFSLFARAATKEISQTEWAWLDTHFDLADFNIKQHTPLLLVSANILLHTDLGIINLSVMPDFSALTPATIQRVETIANKVATWILVENRTSFERVARNRQANEGVIWLPGYPPSWWKNAVSRLIKLAPATAKVACDPDPAGIAIAFSAVEIFRLAGLQATAWKMGADELNYLNNKKPLSAFDNQLLRGLLKLDLPVELKSLADTMLAQQEKGEQEGFL